ncbi:hypothetical protein OESDEN_22044 [Oesophagostomum dentatum]|uniref:Uncharacterized protein n=1 Tax=Oesophagostomum dentatum TaxID=61180 RepID=A0A0B1S531_OESDE|nr:hypothetical protein OESDEN_22044 [Oesophagostomum dentatum]
MNTTTFNERFHRLLKYTYLNKSTNSRIDFLVQCLIDIVRDKKRMHEIVTWNDIRSLSCKHLHYWQTAHDGSVIPLNEEILDPVVGESCSGIAERISEFSEGAPSNDYCGENDGYVGLEVNDELNLLDLPARCKELLHQLENASYF